jgi:Peptidase family M41/ATPase family associated with various cellular activities (AAA)
MSKLKSKNLIYKEKIEILKIAKTHLKAKFVGIDDIIEQLFEYLHIWYLMPEILMRPMIINLWGMTGVGKTDLIRSLVEELKMQNQFLEVELSADGKVYNWDTSVADTFGSRGLEAGKPNIVLFDEIQKFRSIDDKGEEIKVSNFQDFWELLSDGKISDKGKGRELLEMFNETQISMSDKEEGDKIKKETDEPVVEAKIGLWQATKLKKMIKIKSSVLEIAKMTYTDFAAIMQAVFDNNDIYKPTDYNQTLIIISGNLDEAYIDARNVGEVEVDADIFHSTTTKINILNIKEALSRRFRPEQISRFGNIHLIYRSLSKASYHKLIDLKTAQICTQIKSKLGINVKVDYSLNDLIYNNGVFPAQGVRPVFSTITEILECNLSKYLFEAVDGKFDSIALSYSFDKAQIIAKMSSLSTSKTISTQYIGRIDKIKLIENTNNLKALTAVHESGHALIYILNFGLSPLQLKSNIASTASYGFTFSHKIHLTKDFLLKKIQVYLAGHLAEKIVFGEDKTSIGHTTDWREATTLAADYVRRFGFGKSTTTIITTEANSEADKFNTNIDLSNTEIEDLIQEQFEITTQTLIQNKSILVKLAKTLLAESSLSPQQVQKICEHYHIKCNIENENFVVYEQYSKLLENIDLITM